MALVTTTVTPTVRITPFTGISEVQRERSGIARAEEIHTADGIWPATGTGDTRGLIVTWDLNKDYGYVLMDCNAAFFMSGNYVAMEATGWMEIETQTGTDLERQYYPLVNYPSRSGTVGTTQIGSLTSENYNTLYPSGTDVGSMAFSMPVTPTGVLWPYPLVGRITCSTIFGEQVENEPALAYRFFCRFLQYDITQGYNYVVNSPVMTR